MPDALQLLKTRRSIKPIELAGPAPSAAEIETLLTVASRVPDHGKLVPWRFIISGGEARPRGGRAHRFWARTAGHRGCEPRRPARENPGMGAGVVRGRGRHEPRARRPRARLCPPLDHRG